MIQINWKCHIAHQRFIHFILLTWQQQIINLILIQMKIYHLRHSFINCFISRKGGHNTLFLNPKECELHITSFPVIISIVLKKAIRHMIQFVMLLPSGRTYLKRNEMSIKNEVIWIEFDMMKNLKSILHDLKSMVYQVWMENEVMSKRAG